MGQYVLPCHCHRRRHRMGRLYSVHLLWWRSGGHPLPAVVSHAAMTVCMSHSLHLVPVLTHHMKSFIVWLRCEPAEQPKSPTLVSVWHPATVQMKAGNRELHSWSSKVNFDPHPSGSPKLMSLPVLSGAPASAAGGSTVPPTQKSCHSPHQRTVGEDCTFPFSSKLQNFLHHLGSPLQSWGCRCGPVTHGLHVGWVVQGHLAKWSLLGETG